MSAKSETRAIDEATLRGRCASLAAELPEMEPLRSIAFVGALELTWDAADKDSLRLAHGLDYLLRSDVVVAPDFEVDVVNLFHGRDFLADDRTADLVFISFVPNVDHRLFQKVEDSVLERQRDPEAEGRLDPSFFWQARSPRHAASRWRERVRSSGARMLLCVGGKREIGTHVFEDPDSEDPVSEGPVFEGPGWRTIIPTPPVDCQPPYRGWSRERLYGVDWDIPYKWLGMRAREDLLGDRPDPRQRPPRTMLAEALLGRDGA